jgi:acetylornithine deacetylase/succinyl-diaminopimelate desuccinylase-like protein
MTLRSMRTLAAALLLAAPALAHAQQVGHIGKTKWDSTARNLFKELIEINTTESSGSTLKAAQAMAARLKAAGFPDSDVVVVKQNDRKGNLVARLRGRNVSRKPLLLLSHIDVVEAKPEDWTLPPFTFVEKDSTFFGRGVADDKDDGAMHLTTIMRLKAEGYRGNRDIIVALTTDEEGGPDNGVDYLLKNHRPLIEAEYAFNEGGGGRVRDGKYLSHDIQAAEKVYADFRLEVTNPGGHSSQPVKENAIYQLAQALVKIGAYDFPVHLNDVTRTYFERSAAITPGKMGEAMKALAANPNDAAAIATLSSDKAYNSQLRTSCVATMLEGGHAPNALPQRARANVNCRILPNDPPAEIQKTLERIIGDPKVAITVTQAPKPSGPSPLTRELMGEIEGVTKEMWPGVPVIPTMSTGATDGVYLRNAGIPVYGVTGFFYNDTFAHGMNERIPQQGFFNGMEFTYRLVKRVTSQSAVQ